MISVKIGAQQFGVAFSHTKLALIDIEINGNIVKTPEPRRQRRKTECRIWAIDAKPGMTERMMIAHAVSDCSPLDNFCKETGRVLALNKALKLARQSGHPIFTVHSHEEADRVNAVDSEFWRQYALRMSVSFAGVVASSK